MLVWFLKRGYYLRYIKNPRQLDMLKAVSWEQPCSISLAIYYSA